MDRQQKIIEKIKIEGRVNVEDLAQKYSVTAQTIRKDLNELSEKGMITRIHGGAVAASGIVNVSYEARRLMGETEKAAIAKAVSRLIPDDSSLFISIGTTTEACAMALSLHKNLMVITNNINVANQLRHFKEKEVVIASGVVRHADGGIIGEAAVDFIQGFRVDYAIIGISAIDESGSLLDYDFREVKVAQAIIRNAHHVILAADHSKFQRNAPVRVAHLSQINSFVTTKVLHQSIKDIIEQNDIRLIEIEA